MPMRSPYLVAAAAASVALVGALRLATPEHHQFPPLHPELLMPTTTPAAATPDSRVAVPTLGGLTLDQAVQTLCLNGLYVKPQVDSKPAGPDMVDKVVAQDTAEIGRTAVELLRARIADPTRPPRTVVVPLALRPRGSGEVRA